MAAAKQKWTVEWKDPDKGGAFVTYQQNLSRAVADRLASKVRNVISPRWFDHNVDTRVVPDAPLSMAPGTRPA
jgi:hypothetical protein